MTFDPLYDGGPLGSLEITIKSIQIKLNKSLPTYANFF